MVYLMSNTTNKGISSKQLARVHQRRQEYELQGRTSMRWRNQKNANSDMLRAMTPPLPVNYPELPPLFPLAKIERGRLNAMSSSGATNFTLKPKFSSSESVTLSPRSLSSERSVMDYSILEENELMNQSSMNNFCDTKGPLSSERREDAIKKQLRELRLKRGRLILQMASERQEDYDEINKEVSDIEIATCRKRSLQAHFNIVPEGMFEMVTGPPELARMPIEQRREIVMCDLKQKRSSKIRGPGSKESLGRSNSDENERSVQESQIDDFFVKQVYLKKKVNKVITNIGYIKERQRLRAVRRLINSDIIRYQRKASVISEIKRKSEAIQKQVGLLFDFTGNNVQVENAHLKHMVNQIHIQRARKAIVCKDIQTRKRQIDLKTNVNQVIRTQGLKVKLMSELRQFFFKRKLKQTSNAAQHRQTQSQSSSVEDVLRRIRRKIIDRSRSLKARRKVALSLRQVGKARLLKKRVNTVIKAHYRKFKVVKDIKTRGETIHFKARMLKELKAHMVNVEKRRLDRQFSWRHQRERLHSDLLEYVAERTQKNKNEHNLVANSQVVHPNLFEKLFKKEMHQRELKKKMQSDLLMRFLTVDLKAKLCEDVVKHSRTKVQQIEKMALQQRQIRHSQKNKACVLRQIMKREHWMLNPRTKFQRARQICSKARVVAQIKVMGQKLRVVEQIKKQNNLIRFRKKMDVCQIENNTNFSWEAENVTELVTFDDLLNMTPELPIKTRNWDTLRKDTKNQEVLRLKCGVKKQKAFVMMELKMRFAKAECMLAIRKRAEAWKNHLGVRQEIKQRENVVKCLRDIISGSYCLAHVLTPVNNHSLLIIKQQMYKRNVNTVIKQVGRKDALNHEILTRQAQCNRKALVTAEIKILFARAKVCAEIRLRVKQIANASLNHKAVIQELEQRYKHRELTKEINARQKQITLKKSTCTIIKQGGNKIRVNKEILAFGRQKHLKKQVTNLIRQAGLKSRLQDEIKRTQAIMELKEQRELKAKVNLVIRQIAKAHAAKRKVCMVLKQSGLKEKCNKEIRRREYYLFPLPSQQQGQSKSQIKELNEIHHKAQKLSGSKSIVFDGESPVLGRKVSKEGIESMKLLQLIRKARNRKVQQEKAIRQLKAVLTQQKSDFASLNMRAINDKNRLYEKLEDLKQENEILAEMLSKQECEELVKSFQRTPTREIKRQITNRQRQQAPPFYQEIQEFNQRVPMRRKIQPDQIMEPDRLTKILF